VAADTIELEIRAKNIGPRYKLILNAFTISDSYDDEYKGKIKYRPNVVLAVRSYRILALFLPIMVLDNHTIILSLLTPALALERRRFDLDD